MPQNYIQPRNNNLFAILNKIKEIKDLIDSRTDAPNCKWYGAGDFFSTLRELKLLVIENEDHQWLNIFEPIDDLPMPLTCGENLIIDLDNLIVKFERRNVNDYLENCLNGPLHKILHTYKANIHHIKRNYIGEDVFFDSVEDFGAESANKNVQFNPITISMDEDKNLGKELTFFEPKRKLKRVGNDTHSFYTKEDFHLPNASYRSFAEDDINAIKNIIILRKLVSHNDAEAALALANVFSGIKDEDISEIKFDCPNYAAAFLFKAVQLGNNTAIQYVNMLIRGQPLGNLTFELYEAHKNDPLIDVNDLVGMMNSYDLAKDETVMPLDEVQTFRFQP